MTRSSGNFDGYQSPEGSVLVVYGDFDLSSAQALEERIHGDLGREHLVVDLSGTQYIDSTILGVLVRCKKAAGRRMSVLVPKLAKVRRIFEITQLIEFLGVSDTLDEALCRRPSEASR